MTVELDANGIVLQAVTLPLGDRCAPPRCKRIGWARKGVLLGPMFPDQSGVRAPCSRVRFSLYRALAAHS